MDGKLKASAQKVQDFLSHSGMDFKVSELPASTRTAKDAASALGCEVAQIAKSLIFKDNNSGQAVLIITSGSNRVDVQKVEVATGLKLGKADADFVRQQTGFAIGGVPPVGHKNPSRILLDEDLNNFESLWAAAGTPNAVFCLIPAELEQLTKGQYLAVS